MSSNISELVAQMLATCADRVAISTAEQDLTYGDLKQSLDRLCGTLAPLVQDSESPVVILASRAEHSILAIISLFALGKVLVPLDIEQPSIRLRRAIDLVRPQLVIHDDEGLAALTAIDETGRIPRLNLQRDVSPVASGNGMVAVPRDADAPCYIFFTSGSTGEPKGIVGRLKGVSHFTGWEAGELGLDQSVRTSQLTSPAFDAVLRDIFTPLSVGGTICIPPSRRVVADGQALAAWLARAQVTLLHTVPSVLRLLLQALEAHPSEVPPLLAHVCVAGEVLFPSDVKLFFEVFGERVSLHNFYGPSETTMIKLFHRVQPSDATRSSVPVGKAMTGARVLVVDSRQKPCGVGMVGEILIRTPYRSLGYFERPDLTSEVFIPNPMNADPSDLVYRTGDMGRILDNGEIEFVGRRDRQVKINGVRVELGEVEAILHEHPGVVDVAVTEKQRQNAPSELVAYLVLGDAGDLDSIRDFVLQRAAPAMLPRHLCPLQVMPRTVTGKIDYAALPDVDTVARPAASGAAPASPLEVAVAELWRELLQLDELPGVDERFFSLGGHSLLAMQLLSRVEAMFGVNASIRDFLQNPTVRSLAAQIEALFVESAADDDLMSLVEDPR